MRIFKNVFVFIIVCMIVLVTGCFGKNSESVDSFKVDDNELSLQNENNNAPYVTTENEVSVKESNEQIEETKIITEETLNPDDKEQTILTELQEIPEIVVSEPEIANVTDDNENMAQTVEITIGDEVVIPVENTDSHIEEDSDDDVPVVFADAKFESIVRQFLGNPQGDIMQSSLSKIKYADVFTGLTFSYLANPSKEEKILIKLNEEDYPASFDDVKYFTGLEYLSIPFIPVEDLSFISGMENLKYLYMYKANLYDLSPLGNLKNMEELNIAACEIKDISVLKNMASLKKLDISENISIVDYSVLKDLKKLETLKLSGNQISDIGFVSDHSQLLELDLSKNNISDIAPVSNLKNLKSLNLNKNNITDVSQLSQLTNLKKLYITGNSISDINALGDISRFSTLRYDN